MYTIIRRTFLVVAWLALATAASAQQLGTVAGVVRDPSGAVLPGVTVEVASPALIEKVRTAVTDGSGQYRIVNLPPGTYTVTFTLTGFSTVRREGVEVSVGFTAQVERRDEGRRRRGNHHRHRRSARRRHSVGRADAHGDGAGVQGTAVRRVVDPDGRAHARPSARRTPTSAACSAIRRARRSPRMAVTPATACRWSTACGSATCTSART